MIEEIYKQARMKSSLKRYSITLTIAILAFVSGTIAFLIITKKFISSPQIFRDMNRITDYVNREMDRILLLETREEQNEEFRRLKPDVPIVPIRMTLTTAVFKYIRTTPPVILKRVIWNPVNNLNEDYMSMSIKHPHIVKTLKTFRTKRRLQDGTTETIVWIFSEFLDIRLLQKHVAKNEVLISKILADAMEGLQYMHSQSIAHLDLKIGNIMGKTTKNGICYKLIDFGYAQLMPSSGHVMIPKKNYGTYPYKAPEIVVKNVHGLKSDIWSLGAICWFLSLEYTPFYKENYEKDIAAFKKFINVKNENKPGCHQFTFNEATSKELKSFVKTCMQLDPEKRPTIEDLKKHPFIRGRGVVEYSSTDDLIEENVNEDSGYVEGNGTASE